ncbi:hypothetical protein ONE63_002458 [Megalurothrips usitatus]|uniref:ER-bound oxygenase mpaB/mpaB'/Rubber oxygenase catalytic domain-containing protein n=1 Tax=Megalurothrips usitatus TaxID=439358 RepID=A0AAV7XCA3_9NEOP|nr:hypothetical protein ONE63_002458 [Megalurothrips usitatus]
MSSAGCLALMAVFAAVLAAAAPPPRSSRAVTGSAATVWCPDVVLADGWDPVLRRIMDEGPTAWGDSGVPENTPPPWMDARRYAAGKAFIARHTISVTFAHVHSLYLLLAVPSVLDVLVYTGNSDTPDEAFIRYYDTVQGVLSWYVSDAFTAGSWGFEQLKHVRWMHNLVRLDMNDNKHPEEVREKMRLAGNFTGCPVSAGLRRDLDRPLAARAPRPETDAQPFSQDSNKKSKYMSQYDMAITQWAFVGPLIQFPDRYGIGNATEEELDGFVHLWEVLGYALGIDDRFNFCQGGLGPTLRRARQTLAGIVLPSMRRARPPWEYMTRCMADGLGYVLPGIDFRSQLANMLRVTLDAPSPSVEALLTPQQRTATAGYRGVLSDIKENGGLSDSVSSLFLQLVPTLRSLPKEQVKKLRHRPPHRAEGCYARIRP